MKAYKGFNADMTCRGFQFKEGETYEEPEAKLCEKGFHACENPLGCFCYYAPANSVFHKVELDGISDARQSDSKVVARKITIGASINLFDIVKAGVEYIKSKVDWDNAKESNTGDQSAATNTGYYSAATNTGYQSAATNTGNYSAATNTGNYSAATNTGYYSAATNTGNYSAATNTGYQSAATNTGDRSAATNTGNYSAATNTGYQSAATNTGYYSAATNTGDRSAATNTGNYSAATNTGYQSAAEVMGQDSIAIVTGKDSKARGAIGCWLVLTERDSEYHIVDVQAVKVDGKTIKADTWYKLNDKKIVEVI